MYKINFSEIEWETPIQGVRHKKVTQGNRTLRLVEYTPAMPLHWCEKGHIGYVLEGQLEIEFDNETLIFQPGDGIFIPDGKEHRHKGKALTDVVRIVFVENE